MAATSTMLVWALVYILSYCLTFTTAHVRLGRDAQDAATEESFSLGSTNTAGTVIHGDDKDQHYDMNANLTGILDSMLNTGYDMRIRPHASGPPVIVKTSMYVISGFSTLAATMDYNLMTFIRQQWNDPRLQFPGNGSINVNVKLIDSIWVPDMYITNEKDGKLHTLTVKNEALRIYPDGDIMLSMRLSLTLACNMDLRKYPMDVQRCHMTMECYGFRSHDVIMHWHDVDPIEINDDIEIPEFKRPDYKAMEFNKTYSTGDFSSLRVYFVLSRIYDYHLTQSYFPTFIMVIISWVSFWLNPESVPARITLGVTTVLTVTTSASGVRAGLPKVAYVKMIDVWMTTCLGFVFGALLEFALVNYLMTEGKNRKEKEKKAQEINEQLNKTDASSMELDSYNGTKVSKTEEKREEEEISRIYFATTWLVTKVKARNVDRVSRIVFPVAFAIFNIIYWPVCFAGYSTDRLADV